MQVIIIVVQNPVQHDDLGVATAAAVLFRSIGGSVGTAVLRSLFAGTLLKLLGPYATLASTELAALQPAQLAAYANAVSISIDYIFAVAAAIAALSFILSWLVEERPLRETLGGELADRQRLNADGEARTRSEKRPKE